MGLTNSSTGFNTSAKDGLFIPDGDRIIALAGNPNVGKSTVFNALTGMKQHTGNWPGKTVSNAVGRVKHNDFYYSFVDIPGTYSLNAHSAEEEVARNFICFGQNDAVTVVCDATVLERNLNLVLQILEVTDKVVLCINLMDEAERKGISIDLALISERLGIPVIGTVARKKKTLTSLLNSVEKVCSSQKSLPARATVRYDEKIETAILILEPIVCELQTRFNSRWLCLKLLENDPLIIKEIEKTLQPQFLHNKRLSNALETAKNYLASHNIDRDTFLKQTTSATVQKAAEICNGAVIGTCSGYSKIDRKIDKILTGKLTAYPFMLLLLAVIFWITVAGANYPSEWLSRLFSYVGMQLDRLLITINTPYWLHSLLLFGIYNVVSWVVSVMLPPMAIFFPLFTLLEDLGYLPRIAYNLDKPFKKCNACGKQSLTMSMGFGCNCAGIVGCRIIDSPRERMLAILSNNFVPCNGRFPAMITLITLFFVGVGGIAGSLLSAFWLTMVILLGIAATFAATYLLSHTLLKGMPSSFALELPPYRRPQICKVIVRSIFDRTIFVLGRAVAVAVPAGAIIWFFANINIGDASLLFVTSELLDPLGQILGLDGVILMAFILGFPANEIVLPLILMAYTASGTLTDISDLSIIRQILIDNGWTTVTAVCTIVFSLMHWPCSTALITVKKETGSYKWMAVSAVLPTVFGALLCLIINLISQIF